jgi:hypothetical protein
MKNKANPTATVFFNRKWEGRKQNVLVLHKQIYWGDEIAHDQNVLLLSVSKKFGVMHHSKHTMNNNTQIDVNI